MWACCCCATAAVTSLRHPPLSRPCNTSKGHPHSPSCSTRTRLATGSSRALLPQDRGFECRGVRGGWGSAPTALRLERVCGDVRKARGVPRGGRCSRRTGRSPPSGGARVVHTASARGTAPCRRRIRRGAEARPSGLRRKPSAWCVSCTTVRPKGRARGRQRA